MSRGQADTVQATADMSAQRALKSVLHAGGPQVTTLLERTERLLAEVAGANGHTLGHQALATLSAGGKRMRPLLVFLSGAGSDSDELVAGAAAVELLHMATLVHDDVLDRAELRRGRPTVYVAGGRRVATATGDFLFSRAFAQLAATGSRDAVAALSDAASALARGELMQRADAYSPAVTEERYLERCALKTGRLFEAACRLGALFGRLGPSAVAQLGAFGARVGLAFQLLDDVLDVAGPAERTGKGRGTDLRDGTVTLPLIIARRRDRELRRIDLRALGGPAEAVAVCERVAATGALEECRSRALAEVAAAKQALGRAPLPATARRPLELVADGVVERYT